MSDDVVAETRQALANYERTADMGGALTGAFHLGCEARTLMPRLAAEIERLTEQLIDARVATVKSRVETWEACGAYAVGELYDHLGMSADGTDYDAYLADPRGFMRQTITEEQ